MPTYDYECKVCSYIFEAFHGMSEQPALVCLRCYSDQLTKLIGAGAAVIIRGTETPCRGNRGGGTQKSTRKPQKRRDKLGEGVNKGEVPPWRDGPVNKKVLKNPEKYIKEGKVE